MEVTLRLASLIAGAIVLAACVSAPVGRNDLLDFLRDGETRREEVRMRLGEPSAQYEGERILAFRLSKDSGGYVLIKPGNTWSGVGYNLMLAFDGEGVLQRHSLVEVRPP
jgi:hypothetical protein